MSPKDGLAPFLGQFFFLRAKGQWWTEVIRGWVAPAGIAGGFTKYLGADNWLSVAVAATLPVAVEAVGYFLGLYLYQRGGVERDYQLALAKDPYRSESLDLFRQIAADLADLSKRAPTLNSEAIPRVRGPVGRESPPATGS